MCKLTAALADQSQVAEIQAHCCGLLKAGKSWDYIGASVQLMASSQAQRAEQMLLNLGADFTVDLERMARWVELCRKAFREAIDLLKDEPISTAHLQLKISTPHGTHRKSALYQTSSLN